MDGMMGVGRRGLEGQLFQLCSQRVGCTFAFCLRMRGLGLWGQKRSDQSRSDWRRKLSNSGLRSAAQGASGPERGSEFKCSLTNSVHLPILTLFIFSSSAGQIL